MLLVLYSSAYRPIWFDEMVTFTIGGLSNFGAVVDQLVQTATNLNQGTTGIYWMAEYGSLSLFGASWWSMRLPSLLAAGWALIALYVFLRAKSIHPVVLATTPVFAIGYPTLWYYAGEARTYMPLVAGVLGALAYYSLAEDRRRTGFGRALGWGSILVGVLFHPYFLLYWPVIVTFGAWSQAQAEREPLTLRAIWRRANPALVVTGVTTGALLAGATWLRGNIEQSVPWNEWLGSPLPLEILTSLFWPFFQSGWPGLIAALLLMVLVITTRSAKNGNSPIAPVVLIGMAVVLALIVSAASILADFWIFPRQWIASQALVLAALPWLASMVLTREQPGPRIRRVTLWFSVLILAPAVISTAMWQASQLRRWRTACSTSPFWELSESELVRILDEGTFLSNRVWMEFSQANLVQGETSGRLLVASTPTGIGRTSRCANCLAKNYSWSREPLANGQHGGQLLTVTGFAEVKS